MATYEELSVFRKPYFLQGAKHLDTCLLLIHGIGGTPLELRLWAEALNKAGFSVFALLLKGHGTSIEDQEKCTYQDWEKSAEDSYLELKKKYAHVYVCGLSMGGLLATYLAEKYHVEKAVLLAPAWSTKNKSAWLSSFMWPLIRRVPFGKLVLPDGNEKYMQGYNCASLKATGTMMKIIKRVTKKSEMQKIDAEVLLMISKKDTLVDYKKVIKLAASRLSCPVRIIRLVNSGHVLTLDVERDFVFGESIAFLEKD
jgi:carboxylesterase